MARSSRRFGQRVLIAIGLIATVAALGLYAAQGLLPDYPDQIEDQMLKWRLSSPKPSQDIIILDIDERSLALLASQHGRWPWPRSVLADALEKLNGLQPRAVVFNVLMSDADLANTNADSAMEATTNLVQNVVYPFIKLPAQNDAESKLPLSDLPVARVEAGHEADTIAAILPHFGGMKRSLAVANQEPDMDGIVRHYPLRWNGEGYQLPSLVGAALSLGGQSLEDIPDTLRLNWRNKKGEYRRISLGDFMTQADTDWAEAFAGKFVVIGASAPGVGQTKGTAVHALLDDNEILATALDDALSGTYLKAAPGLALLLLNIGTIWLLVSVSLSGRHTGLMEYIFIGTELALVVLMFLGASYFNVIIDLEDNVQFALVVFAAIKLVKTLDNNWSRARAGFRYSRVEGTSGRLAFIGVKAKEEQQTLESQAIQKRLEQWLGLDSVIRVDDLFGGDGIFKNVCESVIMIVAHVPDQQSEQLSAKLAQIVQPGFVVQQEHAGFEWDTAAPGFAEQLAPSILNFASRLMMPQADK